MPREAAKPAEELPSLRRDVDALSERMFLEVSGRRCALLGNELGNFECWIWPIKVCHDLELSIEGAPGSKLARSVHVWPHQSRIEYESGDVRVTQTMFAALDRRAIVVLFDVECERAVELVLRFTPDFRPQWPAGMGGQIALRDEECGAFALTEELGRFAAMFGSPDAEPIRVDADHALPREPVAIRMLVTPARAKRGPIPFFIAGGETEPKPLSQSALVGEEGAAMGHSRAHAVLGLARDEYKRISSDWPRVRERLVAHWRDFLARTTHFESDDALHTEAFLWAKIAIEKAWVEVDGLGLGLVAGLGPSRGGERPGFGWFFDGDAMEASRAMVAYGDFEGAKRVLEFAASHQRADGKMMHELVLSARLCNWVEDYPYAYYKAGNTPDFIDAVANYVGASGDIEFRDRMWPHVRSAYGHCVSCLDDDGLLSNKKAGICAVEAGALVGKIRAEIFLQSLWANALFALIELASVVGDDVLAQDARKRGTRIKDFGARFWSKERNRHGFALLVDDTLCDDLTAYQAHACSNPLLAGSAANTAVAINHPSLASDWGVRFFATDSSVYDPANYNTGSVFPFVNNFAIGAACANGLMIAAHQLLASQVALQSFSGLGFVPEHLYGDRCETPARGVPHQIFSSACIVQATTRVLLGSSPTTHADGVSRMHLTSMPPASSYWQFGKLRGKDYWLDLELRRKLVDGLTHMELRTRTLAGSKEPDVFLALDLPALSSRPRPETSATKNTDTTNVVYESGPELLLDASLTPRGAASSKVRVCEVVHDDKSVEWTLWGLAGKTYRIGWRSDRRVEFEGAKMTGNELEIRFPSGNQDEFTSTKLRAVALD